MDSTSQIRKEIKMKNIKPTVSNATKDRFTDSDDFIARYIKECAITKYEFTVQGPYLNDDEVCLDIGDNNGMQWFVIIENGSFRTITEKIVNYFHEAPIEEKEPVTDNSKLQKLYDYFKDYDSTEEIYVDQIRVLIANAMKD